MVNDHTYHSATEIVIAVSVNEGQDELPTLYWLPKLYKRPYKARFIAKKEKSPWSATITSRSPSQTRRGIGKTKPNKRKSNKRTKSTKISSLLPKRDNRNVKRTEKYKNKMTQDKT